jgi:hypothetical protein
MAYYRGAAAGCDDLAQIRAADAAVGGESVEEALHWPADARDGRTLRDRLRSITDEEVQRIAAAQTKWVTPMGTGFLVANPALDPVGPPIVPFFEALVAG